MRGYEDRLRDSMRSQMGRGRSLGLLYETPGQSVTDGLDYRVP